LRRLVPDPDGGSGVDIVSLWMSMIRGLFRFVLFDVSIMSLLLLLCMHPGLVFVSTISLDAECLACFPSAAVFFFRRRFACSQPFFLVGVSVLVYWCGWEAVSVGII